MSEKFRNILREENLTTGQIELILKKNKIVIPKEFNTSFFKENISKPISKFKSNLWIIKKKKLKIKINFSEEWRIISMILQEKLI